MTIIKTLLPVAFVLFILTTGSAQTKPVNTQADFDAARIKIDSLDNQLIKLLGERERIAQAIGVYKAKNNIAPLQEARFKQVLDKAKANGKKEGLSGEFIEELMNAIHKESLKLENDPGVVHNE